MEQKLEIVDHASIQNLNCAVVEMNYKPRHFHSDFEIIYVLTGKLTVFTEQKEIRLSTDDIILLNAYDTHEVKKASEEPCVLMVLQFSPSVCEGFFPDIYHLRFQTAPAGTLLDAAGFKTLQDILCCTAYNFLRGADSYQFRCMSDVLRMISIYYECVDHTLLSKNEFNAFTSQKYRIERILTYIQRHHAEKITLKDLALQEDISEAYLSVRFKEYLGTTFREYLNGLRLEHAVYLLARTDKKIIDIAEESGFSDSKYLIKAFTEKYRMLPKEFRTLNRRQNASASEEVRLPVSESLDRALSKEEGIALLKTKYCFTE